MGSFLIQFLIDKFAFLRKIFQRFLNRKFAHFCYVTDVGLCIGMTNFWCHFLSAGLLNNQIALLLPVCGLMEFDKIFGIDIDYRRFSPPPPHSRSLCLLSSFSPILCSLLTPSVLLRSPTCSLACLISPPGKGKKSVATRARDLQNNWTFIKANLEGLHWPVWQISVHPRLPFNI